MNWNPASEKPPRVDWYWVEETKLTGGQTRPRSLNPGWWDIPELDIAKYYVRWAGPIPKPTKEMENGR
jgi:hypothetical protein